MKPLNLSDEKGIYLVVDPGSKPEADLFQALERVFRYPLVALQIWDNFSDTQQKQRFIQNLCSLAAPYPFPVLINNAWEWVATTDLDGVHFDQIPENFAEITRQLPKNTLLGLTCTNDLSAMRWAEKNGFDYISFCSVFPSPSAGACELVSQDTLRAAAAESHLPFFLAGGIRTDNLDQLAGIPYRGLALISGILGQPDPEAAMHQFTDLLQTNQKNETRND
jgi:thiamine-phosphate pyrophosphorylase